MTFRVLESTKHNYARIHRVDSDAEIVIDSVNKKVRLSSDSLHQIADFCIWEGWEVTGYPVLTMLRGNIVMQDGKLLAKPGLGRYLPRFLMIEGIQDKNR